MHTGRKTHCDLLLLSLWAWSKKSLSQSRSTVSSAGAQETEMQHRFISLHFKSLMSIFNNNNSVFSSKNKTPLLSSLAWERNFSVVNSGFFSSNTMFQKLENFDSAVIKIFFNFLYHTACVLRVL